MTPWRNTNAWSRLTLPAASTSSCCQRPKLRNAQISSSALCGREVYLSPRINATHRCGSLRHAPRLGQVASETCGDTALNSRAVIAITACVEEIGTFGGGDRMFDL